MALPEQDMPGNILGPALNRDETKPDRLGLLGDEKLAPAARSDRILHHLA